MSQNPIPPSSRTGRRLFRADSVMLPVSGKPTGAVLALSPLAEGEARQLGSVLATIDPWATYGYSADRLTAFFAEVEADAMRWAVRADGVLAGVVVIRSPWLHGPYLHFLAALPEHQGKGIGAAVLRWMEQEARGNVRNLWLCVSRINTRAQAFYRREGFETAAMLDELVASGMDEILMRKRLF